MVYRFSLFSIFALSLWLVCGATHASAQPAMQCTTLEDVRPVIRAEGLSELLSDLVFQCMGGTPTPQGDPVPGIDLRLSLNTSVAAPGLLIFDDPPPTQHVLCSGTCGLEGVGGSGLNFANPAAPENNGQQVTNVFQGQQAGGNSIVWLGIPLDPPGSVGTRIFRIKNVRASASAITVGDSLLGTLSGPVPGLPFTTDLGTVQPVFDYTIRNAATLNQCQPHNPSTPGPPWDPSFTIEFDELAPGGFRTRGTPGGTISTPFPPLIDQNELGIDYGTESGYYSTIVPEGVANFGTRLFAAFLNVPTGARVFVDGISDTSGTAKVIAIQDCLDDATPAPATNGLVEVPITNQQGAICFEVFDASKELIETITLGAYLSFSPLGGTSSPSLGNVLVQLGPAPMAPVSQNRKFMGEVFPVFQSSPDPYDPWRRLYVGARLNSCAPGTADEFTLTTPPEFVEGTFETDGMTGSRSINLQLATTREARPVTATPLIQSTPPARANSVTAGWLTVNQSQPATPVTLTIAVDPTGLAPGTYNGAVRLDSPGDLPLVNQIPIQLIVPPEGPRFGANGVTGAAEYHAGAVAPGQAIVVFGTGYGPPELAGLTLDENGLVSNELAGVRVLFDGIPSPLIYAVEGQVSAFVPFGVAGQNRTEMRIENMGVASPPVFLTVTEALPGLLTSDMSGFGQGAILNQDESINGPDNPAAPGEIVVLFGSGAGQTDPPGVDGQVIGAPLPEQTLPARVWIDGIEARVDYAGPAPTLAAGVLQVNAEVPAGVRRNQSVPVTVDVGEFRSQPGVTVAIR